MRLAPSIAALRSDDAPQREAQAAMKATREAWQALPQTRAVLADLARFSNPNRALADCHALAALFTGEASGAARDWVDGLIAMLSATLRANPLGHVPLRHFTNGMTSSLLLGRAGETTLALAAIDGVAFAAAPLSHSVGFAALDSYELVLAGSGEAEIVSCVASGPKNVDLRREPTTLSPGMVIAGNGLRRVMRLVSVEGCLVTLRLQRRPRDGGVACEYDLASGALLHRAAGTMRESRHGLMVNLLGRMGRKDAAPVLAAMAAENAPADLRWQALREGLGLDTASGFAALAKVAARADDPLAKPAAALQAQLLAQYPALRALCVEAEMA